MSDPLPPTDGNEPLQVSTAGSRDYDVARSSVRGRQAACAPSRTRETAPAWRSWKPIPGPCDAWRASGCTRRPRGSCATWESSWTVSRAALRAGDSSCSRKTIRTRSCFPMRTGLVASHASTKRIVSVLREAVENESGIDFHHHARVRSVEDERVAFFHNGAERSLTAGRIVGADGRASTVRRSLGVSPNRLTCSRMVGVTARGASLPLEGYGYVLLGGPGPVLMYQLGEHCVRIIVDVPLGQWSPRDRRVRQLRGTALEDRTRVAEPRRNVRRLDDRALLCRVYGILPGRTRRLQGTLRASHERRDDEVHREGRRVASPDPGQRWIVARRVGHTVHLRHALRSQGSGCRRGASRRSGVASRVPLVARPSAGGRGMG